jgi:perosamine synthetase
MIQLSIPNISETEQMSVARAIESGWVSTAGPDIGDFERKLAQLSGVRFAIAVNSGSAALHLALLALGVQKGDYVICPNLSFVATANAVVHAGAEPILIDAAPDNLQLDLDLLEAFLRDETDFNDGQCYHTASRRPIRALVQVHVLGDFCDMDRLLELARSRGIPVLEDAAAAVGASYDGKPAGSMGLMGTLSFNGNKIMTTGGGGAVLTNDSRLADHVRHLAHQAKSFPLEYIHDAAGFNYGMPNLNAAFGLGQLARLPEFWAAKQAIRTEYEAGFIDVRALTLVPHGDLKRNCGYWLNCVFTTEARQLEAYLEANEIQTRKLWVPMNRLPMYGQCLYIQRDDHSFRWYEESLCLPSSTGLSNADQAIVIQAVRDFFH